MFLVIHVLLGALIGLRFNSVIFVFVAAFVSHFLLDAIPHWDGNFNNTIFRKFFIVRIDKIQAFITGIDTGLAFALIYFLFLKFGSLLVLIGGIGAVFPDFFKIGYYTPLIRQKWYRRHLLFHSKIQKETDWKLGIFTQVIVSLILIAFLAYHLY